MPPTVPNGIDPERMAKYFKDHDIEEFLVSMLLDIAQAKPEDPQAYLVDFLRARQASDASTVASRTPHSGVVSPDHTAGLAARLSSQLQQESADVQGLVAGWVDETEQGAGRGPGKLGRLGTAKLELSNRQESGEYQPSQLEEVLDWDFDIVTQDDWVLVKYAKALLEEQAAVGEIGVDKKALGYWIELVKENYIADNPFHSWKHGFHVMTVMVMLLREGGDRYTNKFTKFAVLIGALAHDVGHPGFNNDYLVKSKHELAIRYNDVAVLENMHACLAFELMLGEQQHANFMADLADADYFTVRKTMISVILATDMKVHFDMVSQLQALASQAMNPEDEKSFDLVQRVLVHAADLSNPVLPTHRARDWAYRAVLEFHTQAELEKSEGLPFAPFMEPHPDNTLELAKLQTGFISFVVKPYWTAVAELLPRLRHRVDQLEVNLQYWNDCKEGELAKQQGS
mmetsp:Transcript_50491/g.133011  ORF Transcript_50491/g.133011 Transcript_50491/m.133011 type:complete len:457 (+) Transcript_50491:44-1414(+)